ncbi:MAG: glycosyltransferase, partial [Chloroflexi bacterium]|nr:glycosyltransferase [Chloroflexota bacterium]
QRHQFPNNSFTESVNGRILSSDPTFLFTISPESSFEYYAKWIDHGARLVSLPLACDTTLYPSDPPFKAEFRDVQIAFVGGYWPYKARQLDRYLKPYADHLKVFGYSRWPYAGYGGRLPEQNEASLYHQAKLSPTINEPHVELMGIDLNERVFKVLGSGGMTITDATPAYREWFDDQELLVPGSIVEYHEMVRRALEDDEFNQRYRRNGHRAVIARHTYAHRAKRVLDLLGIQLAHPSENIPDY